MVEFWTKVAAIAAVGQVVVLIATAWFVWRYLQETTELRRAAQRQVALANEQLEAQIRPALTIADIGGSLSVANIGSGAALNLRMVKTKTEGVDWGAKSNFGEPVTGVAIAAGQSVSTRYPVGSYGNLRDERLHLLYESLAGKLYASIVTFDGVGRPSGVRCLARA